MNKYPNFIEDNEFVRPPEPIQTIRLNDNNTNTNTNSFLSEEEQLNLILQQSINEFEIKSKKKEEEQLNIIVNELNKRKTNCEPIIHKLKKLTKYDSNIQNQNIYIYVLDILEQYTSGYIEYKKINHNKYIQIYNVLKGIRFRNDEVDLLKKIFILK